MTNKQFYLLTFGVSGWFAGVATIVSMLQDMGIILNYNTALMSFIGLITSIIIGVFMIAVKPADFSNKYIILFSALSGITVVLSAFLGILFNNLSV